MANQRRESLSGLEDFLNEDLSESKVAVSCLKEAADKHVPVPKGTILQVVSAKDVTFPTSASYDRLKTKKNYSSMVLKYCVTDGFTTANALFPNGHPNFDATTYPGTKMRLLDQAYFSKNGMLVLHSKNVESLGGHVAKLATDHEQKVELLKTRAWGAIGNSIGGVGPPPWVPFGAKSKIKDYIGVQKEGFKAMQAVQKAREEAGKKDDKQTEFGASREEVISNLMKNWDPNSNKPFAEGKQLLNKDVVAITSEGFTEDEAKMALRRFVNNRNAALKFLTDRRDGKRPERRKPSRRTVGDDDSDPEPEPDPTHQPSDKITLFGFIKPAIKKELPELSEDEFLAQSLQAIKLQSEKSRNYEGQEKGSSGYSRSEDNYSNRGRGSRGGGRGFGRGGSEQSSGSRGDSGDRFGGEYHGGGRGDRRGRENSRGGRGARGGRGGYRGGGDKFYSEESSYAAPPKPAEPYRPKPLDFPAFGTESTRDVARRNLENPKPSYGTKYRPQSSRPLLAAEFAREFLDKQSRKEYEHSNKPDPASTNSGPERSYEPQSRSLQPKSSAGGTRYSQPPSTQQGRVPTISAPIHHPPQGSEGGNRSGNRVSSTTGNAYSQMNSQSTYQHQQQSARGFSSAGTSTNRSNRPQYSDNPYGNHTPNVGGQSSLYFNPGPPFPVVTTAVQQIQVVSTYPSYSYGTTQPQSFYTQQGSYSQQPLGPSMPENFTYNQELYYHMGADRTVWTNSSGASSNAQSQDPRQQPFPRQ